MTTANKEVTTDHTPNPRRVAAGRRNRQKRKGLTEAGRQRLREAALRNQPWRYSTGPRTLEGKARAAANGKARQKGPLSVREIRRDIANLHGLAQQMCDSRSLVEELLSDGCYGT